MLCYFSFPCEIEFLLCRVFWCMSTQNLFMHETKKGSKQAHTLYSVYSPSCAFLPNSWPLQPSHFVHYIVRCYASGRSITLWNENHKKRKPKSLTCCLFAIYLNESMWLFKECVWKRYKWKWPTTFMWKSLCNPLCMSVLF